MQNRLLLKNKKTTCSKKSLCQCYQSTAPFSSQLVGQKFCNKFTRFDNACKTACSYEITLQVLLYMFIGCSFTFSVAIVKRM